MYGKWIWLSHEQIVRMGLASKPPEKVTKNGLKMKLEIV